MDTDMHRAADPGGDPAGWASPSEVTGVFLWLASDDSRETSGRRFRAQEDWRAGTEAGVRDHAEAGADAGAADRGAAPAEPEAVASGEG
jgi:hypothetical protein